MMWNNPLNEAGHHLFASAKTDFHFNDILTQQSILFEFPSLTAIPEKSNVDIVDG